MSSIIQELMFFYVGTVREIRFCKNQPIDSNF